MRGHSQLISGRKLFQSKCIFVHLGGRNKDNGVYSIYRVAQLTSSTDSKLMNP